MFQLCPFHIRPGAPILLLFLRIISYFHLLSRGGNQSQSFLDLLNFLMVLKIRKVNKNPAIAKTWTADLPVALRALYQLDHGNPRIKKFKKII